MRRNSWIPLMLFVVAVALIMVFAEREFGQGAGGAFLASSRDEQGVSLLFDTLRHMGYPVSVSNRPVGWRGFSGFYTGDVFIVIQPNSPPVDEARAREMIEWVWRGGRLIFLQNAPVGRTIIDEALRAEGFFHSWDFRGDGNMVLYHVGHGEVLTGRAFEVLNCHLMDDPAHGRIIEDTLARWDADRIFFAEYYHGFHASDNFIGSLPLIVRLVLFQMGLAAVVLVWHLGKRFGRPIPYYEETEREENEYVRALARLIWRAK